MWRKVFQPDFDSNLTRWSIAKADEDYEEDDLDEMINSKRGGEGVKLWGDVLAQSVIHVKPGTVHFHHHHDKIGDFDYELTESYSTSTDLAQMRMLMCVTHP